VFGLGHEISGDTFPPKKIRVVVPNDALFMHRVSGNASSGPEARNVAKKFATIASESCFCSVVSPCSSVAVPFCASVRVNPSVFVEPEFTMRTSVSIGTGVSLSIKFGPGAASQSSHGFLHNFLKNRPLADQFQGQDRRHVLERVTLHFIQRRHLAKQKASGHALAAAAWGRVSVIPL
jgi:hypothetical protein